MEGNGYFCGACFAALNRIVAPFCQRCGTPFAFPALGKGDGICTVCRNAPPSWQRARAAFVYDDASRRLLLPFKYADRLANQAPLAYVMGQTGADILQDAAFLMPVPLHRVKLRQRHYNQAALLANRLGRQHNVPVMVDALQRLRPTRSLASLSVAERQEELRGVMVVSSRYWKRLKGQRVVLIDDILTTGATAEACTYSLLEAGCSAVDVLVAARVCLGEEAVSF